MLPCIDNLSTRSFLKIKFAGPELGLLPVSPLTSYFTCLCETYLVAFNYLQRNTTERGCQFFLSQTYIQPQPEPWRASSYKWSWW